MSFIEIVWKYPSQKANHHFAVADQANWGAYKIAHISIGRLEQIPVLCYLVALVDVAATTIWESLSSYWNNSSIKEEGQGSGASGGEGTITSSTFSQTIVSSWEKSSSSNLEENQNPLQLNGSFTQATLVQPLGKDSKDADENSLGLIACRTCIEKVKESLEIKYPSWDNCFKHAEELCCNLINLSSEEVVREDLLSEISQCFINIGKKALDSKVLKVEVYARFYKQLLPVRDKIDPAVTHNFIRFLLKQTDYQDALRELILLFFAAGTPEEFQSKAKECLQKLKKDSVYWKEREEPGLTIEEKIKKKLCVGNFLEIEDRVSDWLEKIVNYEALLIINIEKLKEHSGKANSRYFEDCIKCLRNCFFLINFKYDLGKIDGLEKEEKFSELYSLVKNWADSRIYAQVYLSFLDEGLEIPSEMKSRLCLELRAIGDFARICQKDELLLLLADEELIETLHFNFRPCLNQLKNLSGDDDHRSMITWEELSADPVFQLLRERFGGRDKLKAILETFVEKKGVVALALLLEVPFTEESCVEILECVENVLKTGKQKEIEASKFDALLLQLANQLKHASSVDGYARFYSICLKANLTILSELRKDLIDILEVEGQSSSAEALQKELRELLSSNSQDTDKIQELLSHFCAA